MLLYRHMTDLKKEPLQKSEAGSFEVPEKIEASPEHKETAAPKPEKKSDSQPSEAAHHAKPTKRHYTALVLPPVKDPLEQKVEKILEESVGDAYSRLSPIAKQEFKLKGEVTARKISELLRGTHVKAKKIFELIISWLRLLPGINRFFLEQEAKIKTDRILSLHNRK